MIVGMEERMILVLQKMGDKFKELEPTADNNLAFCLWFDRFMSQVIIIAESLGRPFGNS